MVRSAASTEPSTRVRRRLRHCGAAARPGPATRGPTRVRRRVRVDWVRGFCLAAWATLATAIFTVVGTTQGTAQEMAQGTAQGTAQELAGTVAAGAAGEAPGVVVSILPLHALVAAVMAGVGTPRLLVRGGASPHDATLRPSDARALSAAKLVVWAGPGLEAFLVRPLAALAARARVLTLTEAPGMVLLERRDGGTFEAGAEPEPDGHGHSGPVNPHLWLDPRNAMEISRQAAAALAEIDPGHAPRYAANAARLIARLEMLDRELTVRLGPVAEIPFAVFHDAYPYLEARYALRALGALTVDPAVPPGARRLAELRALLAERGAACVFAEPQFNPALVAAMTEGSGARVATLDPLGAALTPGPEAYFVLMRDLAEALVRCLKGGE